MQGPTRWWREPGLQPWEGGTSAKEGWPHRAGEPAPGASPLPPSDGALSGPPRCEELDEGVADCQLAPEELDGSADENLDRGADLGEDLNYVDQHAVCPIGKTTGLEMLDHLLGLELGHSVGESDEDRCAPYVGRYL